MAVMCSVVVVVIRAATAAVAVLVVNETLLEEVVGVLQSAVVMSIMVLVELNRPDHVDARSFLLLACNSHTRRACIYFYRATL